MRAIRLNSGQALNTKTITKNASFGESIFVLDFDGDSFDKTRFFARGGIFFDHSPFLSLVYRLLKPRDKLLGFIVFLGCD